MAGRGRGIGLEKLKVASIPGAGRGRGIANLLSSFTAPTRSAGRGSAVLSLASSLANRNVPGPVAVQVSEEPARTYSTRPDPGNSKEGSSGTTVALAANYFKLITLPSFEFNMYRVDFSPDVEHLGIRKACLAQHKDILGGGYLFDGQNSLFTTRCFTRDRIELKCETREGDTIMLTVRNTRRTIDMHDASAVQILNLILRRTMDGLEMQLVGRNLYDPKNKVALTEFQLELWPGYISSIRQHEHDVLVCCEVSHKVMRLETVYDIMRTLREESRGNWQDDFKKQIVGATVLTAYNNNTYRVDDVFFDASPLSTFKKGEVDVTYKAYYKEKYNIPIRDENQPMLVSNPKPRDVRAGRNQVIFLVPELCRATGLTDKMRANFQMMKAMAVHTQMDPVKRVQRLLDFTRRIHQSKESLAALAAFNTDIDSGIVKFKGRALAQEKMLFGGNKVVANNDNVDWTNPMKMNEMFDTVPLKRWAFVYPKRSARESEVFLKLLQEVATGMRYECSEPQKFEIPDDRLTTYTTKLEEIISKDPKLIMIVLPNNSADRYAAIKRLTCINRAIPTQIMLHKTMMEKKGSMAGVKSIATKVVVQLNCKLGGAPWMIKFPIVGAMVIGFDVNHDTRDRNKSYGAFIASMDHQSVYKYYSAVSHHTNGVELSANISTHMRNALKAYLKVHKTLPERIFFYRDGVGDGQIEYVHKQEVGVLEQTLKQCYSEVQMEGPPKFTFIIVTKRLNTRIFLDQNRSMANPASGTVVDNTITLQERYDFYLVSQSVRQGTVAPTSYNIIHDTNGLPADKLQMFTYKLCHLYYNWSGTVRVPAAVQYAHKLALLVGEFLHAAPSEDFDNQLFFL